MAKHIQDLTTLRFDGPRFEDHSLEIDVLPELIAYKKLLVETAKELWRKKNPGRERLPRGFEDSIAIKFFQLGNGSTAIPLKREYEIPDGETLPLGLEDEFDEAAEAIEKGIDAATQDRPLPDVLPRNVIPFFEALGKTLRPQESIGVRARRSNREVRYTSTVRDRLMQWVESIYEDFVDLTGEVRAANIDGYNFALRQDDGRKVTGVFAPAQEALITGALSEHSTVRLRVKGVAEFSRQDGGMKRIVRVDDVQVVPAGEPQYVQTEKPIWEIVASIGAQVPTEEWDKVPSDLSKNLDHYLYGTPKDE